MVRNIFVWKVVTALVLIGLLLGGGYAAYKIGLTQGMALLGSETGEVAASFLSIDLGRFLDLLIMVILFVVLLKMIGRTIFFLTWLFSPGAKKMTVPPYHFHRHRMRPHYWHPHAHWWGMPFEEYSEQERPPSTKPETQES